MLPCNHDVFRDVRSIKRTKKENYKYSAINIKSSYHLTLAEKRITTKSEISMNFKTYTPEKLSYQYLTFSVIYNGQLFFP